MSMGWLADYFSALKGSVEAERVLEAAPLVALAVPLGAPG